MDTLASITSDLNNQVEKMGLSESPNPGCKPNEGAKRVEESEKSRYNLDEKYTHMVYCNP